MPITQNLILLGGAIITIAILAAAFRRTRDDYRRNDGDSGILKMAGTIFFLIFCLAVSSPLTLSIWLMLMTGLFVAYKVLDRLTSKGEIYVFEGLSLPPKTLHRRFCDYGFNHSINAAKGALVLATANAALMWVTSYMLDETWTTRSTSSMVIVFLFSWMIGAFVLKALGAWAYVVPILALICLEIGVVASGSSAYVLSGSLDSAQAAAVKGVWLAYMMFFVLQIIVPGILWLFGAGFSAVARGAYIRDRWVERITRD